MKSPAEFMDELLVEVEKRQADQLEKLATRLAANVVGFDVSRWGDFERISPELIERVKRRIGPKVLEAFYDSLANEVVLILTKRSTKTLAQKIARSLIPSIENAVTESVFQKSLENLEEEVGEIVSQIMRDKLQPWFIASKFISASKKTVE